MVERFRIRHVAILQSPHAPSLLQSVSLRRIHVRTHVLNCALLVASFPMRNFSQLR